MDDFKFSHSNQIHIPHLSASTINSFITSRYQFYQNKVKQTPFKGNEHTCRGKAVEHAVNVMIEQNVTDIAALIEEAIECFDKECRESGVSAIQAEDHRDSIPGLVKVAINHYTPIFAEVAAKTQHKIEVQLDGVTRTLVGYLDFFQPTKAVRDSKLSSKTPSSLSQSYIIQGALYRKATGLPVFFDFFIPNKTPVAKSIMLNDDEYLFGLSYLTAAAKVLEELATCDNPRRILELMSFPDLSAMFGNRREIAQACEQWGITYK